MQKTKVYLDLDGCLCDFDRAVFDLTGVRLDKQTQSREFIDEVLERVGTEGGVEFWANIPWIEEGKTLWDFLRKLPDIDLTILSSPGTKRGAAFVANAKIGKPIWVKRELGNYPLILESNKKIYAKSGSILIDDYKKNIDRWVRAGGTGLLYKSAFRTIVDLVELLTDGGPPKKINSLINIFTGGYNERKRKSNT